jgi:polyhydroxyalkanoate synthesis regulator phasin
MAQSKTVNERVVRRAQRLRSELGKIPLLKQAEDLGERAVRGIAERVAQRLDRSPIATRRKVAAIDRRIAGLTRRVSKLEKGRA